MMYPENMTKLYSNGTCRKSRVKGINEVVVFGMQHFIKEYLIKDFNENFFMWKLNTSSEYFGIMGWKEDNKNRLEKEDFYRYKWDKDNIIKEYKRHCPVNTTHIEALWDLGYLPIEIKAIEEGTLLPIGVPMFTITNTHPDFGWLVNYLETLMSCMLWQAYTSATIAFEFKKLLTKYAKETTGNADGVQWQAHDFSMRGMSSPESAILSGMGHLTSFTGTDTIPAIYQLEKSYNATGLIGASVPATEHSVMCMGQKEEEIETFKRLLNLFPTGILSVVSDTWDLWKVCTEYLPQLKEEILSRDGKLVIRPDSGDPADIICGTCKHIKTLNSIPDYDLFIYYVEETGKYYETYTFGNHGRETDYREVTPKPKDLGVIELLWDVFGGTINEQGYKILDPNIGAIYGDSITLERATAICERLKAKGFASTNVVFGVGSYTYQYNTRDTFGFAVKATYGEITHIESQGAISGYAGGQGTTTTIEPREIFKDPITDDGTKKSKKGLLCVLNETTFNKDKSYSERIVVLDQCTLEQEQKGLLKTVFLDSKLVKETNLEDIRNKLNSYL